MLRGREHFAAGRPVLFHAARIAIANIVNPIYVLDPSGTTASSRRSVDASRLGPGTVDAGAMPVPWFAFVFTTHGGPCLSQLWCEARMGPAQHIFPPPGRLLHPLPPHFPHFGGQQADLRRMPVLHEGSAFFGLDRVTRALATEAKERRINICAIAEAFMIISTLPTLYLDE